MNLLCEFIQCEVCETWFHAACQHVLDKVSKENEAMHWYHKECQEKLEGHFMVTKQDVTEVKKDVEMLRHKTSEISQELTELMELKDEAAWLQTEQEDSDGRTETFAEIVSKQVEMHMVTVHDEVKVVQQTLSETREQAREEKDKENRLNNVILYTVPESDADTPERKDKAKS